MSTSSTQSSPSRVPKAGEAISPRLLRCFVVLSEELHFGAASDRLYVAQPALSRSIQRLESKLGRVLFTRTTRAVQLTPAGAALVRPARDVLHELDRLAEEVDAAQQRLRVAHVPGSDTTALILDRLAIQAPAIEINERALNDADQLAALRDGELDVAVCRAPATPEPGLRAHLVRLDPLLVAVLARPPGERRPVDLTRRIVAVGDGGARHTQWGSFVDGYERVAGASLRRVPVADGCGTEAYALRRAGANAFLTLASFGVRVDCVATTAPALPVQAYWPWSVVHRAGTLTRPARAFIHAARHVANARHWLQTDQLPGLPWIPEDGCEKRP
jgi:DNA-binding transcriptional LysR family regulator